MSDVTITDATPILVLGAGYAGLRIAQEISRRSKGKLPVTLIDRHPVHVLRTELYEIDELAQSGNEAGRWLVPISTALNGQQVTYEEGFVEAIDLTARTVSVAGHVRRFGALALCLGSVPAFYGVPGAKEIPHQVYGFTGARRLALTLKDLLAQRAGEPKAEPLRVVVIGGGSTGTELAAEIATASWTKIAAPGAKKPSVTIITGSVPFLAGLPDPVVQHARTLLTKAKVRLLEHRNVTRVEETQVVLEDGEKVPFDVSAWCAGVQAPGVIRALPVPHGHSGRVTVDPYLEIPGFPGVFAVGDVAEFQDPTTGVIAPATAQAALAEAPVAAANIVARARGRPMTPFVYRERGVIVAVGIGKGSGRAGGLTVWGRPAALVKKVVEKGYAYATEHGTTPRGL
ncbi:MAG: FAD-dependent oxidoreductase [Thermoplasmata archaeon]|nr:FAD-dependent oxidoreductase [Thermoplasmata archaeon]